MEKAAKSKNKMLKYLPRAASAVSFRNPPLSPGRDKRFSHAAAKGFSGPIVSLVPDVARRDKKKDNAAFDTQEPTSPKVSCMGQIKHKHKPNSVSSSKPVPTKSAAAIWSPRVVKKQAAAIRRIFGGAGKSGNHGGNIGDKQFSSNRVPSIGQLQRFASGRDTFANFDWTAQITPVESDHRDYYSDEEGGGGNPFSAPIRIGGGGMPRKEVNLWKRRTMAAPKPLQL